MGALRNVVNHPGPGKWKGLALGGTVGEHQLVEKVEFAYALKSHEERVPHGIFWQCFKNVFQDFYF